MANLTKAELAALERVPMLDDPERLRTLIANARRQGSLAVERAAFARLCEVQPAAALGTVAHDVWRSIHALEEMLTDKRGKTVRLSRTRQKIARDGEVKTVADLVARSVPSDGFHQLVEMGHPGLLFEAVVLRHPREFDPAVEDAARTRLLEWDIDPERLGS